MGNSYTSLNGISSFNDPPFDLQLQVNLISFLNFGLLQVSGFGIAARGQSGVYGGDPTRLRYVDDPNYPSGVVYEAFRRPIVWETGISNLFRPSGVYINNSFVPVGSTGMYSNTVDYTKARVVFNSPIPIGTAVNLEYCYRAVSIEGAEAPWFREVQFNTYRLDQADPITLAQNRMPLPAVVVEVDPNRSTRPLMIGGGHYIYQDVLFHIFSEDESHRRLIDILDKLTDKTIFLYDMRRVAADRAYSLNYDGTLASGATNYDKLIENYTMTSMCFERVSPQTITLNPFKYSAIVRATCEIRTFDF